MKLSTVLLIALAAYLLFVVDRSMACRNDIFDDEDDDEEAVAAIL